MYILCTVLLPFTCFEHATITPGYTLGFLYCKIREKLASAHPFPTTHLCSFLSYLIWLTSSFLIHCFLDRSCAVSLTILAVLFKTFSSLSCKLLALLGSKGLPWSHFYPSPYFSSHNRGCGSWGKLQKKIERQLMENPGCCCWSQGQVIWVRIK